MMRRNTQYLLASLSFILLVGASGCDQWEKWQQKRYKKRINEQMLNVVKSGEIVIDEMTHEWRSNLEKMKIDMYIRNKSPYQVDGVFCFSVQSTGEGLEKEWLNKIIEVYGEEELKLILNKRKEKTPRILAILSYINRGSKFPNGLKYEPIEPKEEGYLFCFHKDISLKAGELKLITHEQEIPPNRGGGIFNVKIGGFNKTVWLHPAGIEDDKLFGISPE